MSVTGTSLMEPYFLRKSMISSSSGDSSKPHTITALGTLIPELIMKSNLYTDNKEIYTLENRFTHLKDISLLKNQAPGWLAN